MRISSISSREYPETVAGWSGSGRDGARRVGARRGSGLGGDEVGQRYIFSNQDSGLRRGPLGLRSFAKGQHHRVQRSFV